MSDKEYQRYKDLKKGMSLTNQKLDTLDYVHVVASIFGLFNPIAAQMSRNADRKMKNYWKTLSVADRSLFERMDVRWVKMGPQRYLTIKEEINALGKWTTSDSSILATKKHQYFESLSLEDQDLYREYNEVARKKAEAERLEHEIEAMEKTQHYQELRQELKELKGKYDAYRAIFFAFLGVWVMLKLHVFFSNPF